MTSTIAERGRLARMTTIVSQQPWFATGTIAQRRDLAARVAAARERAQQRFTRVKAHPDLAERVCRSLRLTRIDQWNGYVPELRDADGRLNTSPSRSELVAVLHSVAEREQATP